MIRYFNTILILDEYAKKNVQHRLKNIRSFFSNALFFRPPPQNIFPFKHFSIKLPELI